MLNSNKLLLAIENEILKTSTQRFTYVQTKNTEEVLKRENSHSLQEKIIIIIRSKVLYETDCFISVRSKES